MRVLLDTNVLISAFVARGLCSELLEHCAGSHTLVTSLAIVEETREKLLFKFRLPESSAERAVQTLFREWRSWSRSHCQNAYRGIRTTTWFLRARSAENAR